jgi:hypothetical protein
MTYIGNAGITRKFDITRKTKEKIKETLTKEEKNCYGESLSIDVRTESSPNRPDPEELPDDYLS